MDWEVKYYRTQAGREPAAEFIDSLSDEDVAKVFRTIGLLVGRGVMLKEPYSRQINGKMRELRISCNRKEVRIFILPLSKGRFFCFTGLLKRPRRRQRGKLNWGLNE